MQKRALYTQPSTSILPNVWDLFALILVALIVMSLGFAFSHMIRPFQVGQPLPISLNPYRLFSYAAQTTVRMFIALGISFIFSFIVGTIAAKSRRAEQILIPLIDILQSVPILGYLSIAVVGFIALFPGSMLGPECAAIFAVFTSQVWNMTLSFYQSMKTLPPDLVETTHLYHLSSWQRFWRLEVPFSMPGLLWNAMMSMSGGWFFVVAAEAISVANQKMYLPGIGSYIAVAITHKDLAAIGWAILTMFVVIGIYDQVIFRPLVTWSEKFKMDDTPDEPASSWLLNVLNRTRLVKYLAIRFGRFTDFVINNRLSRIKIRTKKLHQMSNRAPSKSNQIIWYALLLLIFAVLCYFTSQFIFKSLPFSATYHVIYLGLLTALRVFIMIALTSLIWVPVGVWVGMRPKVTAWVMPLVQFLASFPANVVYPVAVVVILQFHLNIEIWAGPLMVLGTQWYILFNIVAGASAIPKELKLAAQNMQLKGWVKWKRFLLPSIFPYYITGAIAAAGASWNASIVAEVIQWGHTTLIATGLGSYITENTHSGNFAKLTLGIVIMCAWVVLINVTLWRKLYQFAQERFNING